MFRTEGDEPSETNQIGDNPYESTDPTLIHCGWGVPRVRSRTALHMRDAMDVSVLIQLGFYVLVVGPIIATVLAFKAPPPADTFARYYLLLTWLVYGAATAWCLWTGFFKPSSGIGNGVFLIIAIPLSVITGIAFSVWRAAHRRHAYP
jgi:hypothetical protein